jgi:hypothetical protein
MSVVGIVSWSAYPRRRLAATTRQPTLRSVDRRPASSRRRTCRTALSVSTWAGSAGSMMKRTGITSVSPGSELLLLEAEALGLAQVPRRVARRLTLGTACPTSERSVRFSAMKSALYSLPGCTLSFAFTGRKRHGAPSLTEPVNSSVISRSRSGASVTTSARRLVAGAPAQPGDVAEHDLICGASSKVWYGAGEGRSTPGPCTFPDLAGRLSHRRGCT